MIKEEIFIKNIDEESKLYRLINDDGDNYYVIKELDEGGASKTI